MFSHQGSGVLPPGQSHPGLAMALGLEQRYVAYSGYLTKSPPMHKVKSRIARWHMRYFVLFDTSYVTDSDCHPYDNRIQSQGITNGQNGRHDRLVYLSYFKNHTAFKNGEDPFGMWILL